MTDERRSYSRFPIVKNVGEPVELKYVSEHKKISIPGYIQSLSEGGVGIITLGERPVEFTIGMHFILNLKLPKMASNHVEGKIIRLHTSRRAEMHHSHEEWFLALEFTKISAAATHHIRTIAEDWSDCETKIQMGLPDVCFSGCSFWEICEKSVKIKVKPNSPKHGK